MHVCPPQPHGNKNSPAGLTWRVNVGEVDKELVELLILCNDVIWCWSVIKNNMITALHVKSRHCNPLCVSWKIYFCSNGFHNSVFHNALFHIIHNSRWMIWGDAVCHYLEIDARGSIFFNEQHCSIFQPKPFLVSKHDEYEKRNWRQAMLVETCLDNRCCFPTKSRKYSV